VGPEFLGTTVAVKRARLGRKQGDIDLTTLGLTPPSGLPFGGVPLDMEKLAPTSLRVRPFSFIQRYVLRKSLPQDRPRLLDDRPYYFRGSRQIVDEPHTLPSREREMVGVIFRGSLSVNICGPPLADCGGPQKRVSIAKRSEAGTIEFADILRFPWVQILRR